MRWSAQIHAEFHVFCITQEHPKLISVFGYGPVTLYGALFHALHLTSMIPYWSPTTPKINLRFRLIRFRSPLLTESISLSFPPVTEMFHFTGYRVSFPMYSGRNNDVLTPLGYPIRKSPGYSLSAANRSLSQLITSFIAC